MKTRKHGQGMTHKQIVKFSNRMAYQGTHHKLSPYFTYEEGFNDGWAKACKYFAHQLRLKLREYESINEI